MIALARPLSVAIGVAMLSTGALAADPVPATLTLSADGVVSAAPDMAIVSLGVVEQAATAGEALSANTTAMRATLDALRQAGVADRDVGTSEFAIEPVMVYPPQKPDGSQEPPTISGYRVSNAVTVKVRDVAKAGGLLDKVVRVGANQVQNVVFTVADQDSLTDAARIAAVKAVKARAALYAEAGGFAVKRILSVSEGGPVTAPVLALAKAAPTMEQVPLAIGEQDVRVTVTMTWEIAPVGGN